MPAFGVGFSRGVPAGLATARQRRLEDEERLRRHEREDWTFQRAQDTAPYEDRLRDLQIESQEHGLERSRRGAEMEDWRFSREQEVAPHDDRMRDLQRESAELGLEGARFQHERSQVAAGREDQDRATQEATAAAAAFPMLFEGLRQGMDPELLRRRYNETSPRKLARIDVDPDSGMVQLTDDEGESVAHPLEAWLEAYPTQKGDPIKIGKDDRLIDPKTFEDLVEPRAGAGVDGDGDAVAGGRKLATFNPESFAKDVSVRIAEAHGGELGLMGQITGIQDPEARQLALYQQALGEDIAGRFRDPVASGVLSASEIANAVVESTKGVESDLALEKAAERWRTQGRNKTPEQAQAWFEAERNRQRMQAQARLERAVQRLLEKGTPSAPAEPEKPDWAGDEVPASVTSGAQLDPNIEYDVRIGGRETTIRVAPDGKVYEVGKTQTRTATQREPEPASPAPVSTPPAAAEAAPAPESTLEDVAPEPTAASEAAYGGGRPGISDEIGLVSDLYRSRPWIRDEGMRERRSLPSFESLRETRGQQRVAERVSAALAEGRRPWKSDMRILSELDDSQLAALGVPPEQIAAIREESAVEATLSQARRSAEFTY